MQVAGGEWLADLPQGLDTDVGERGANLSMGQRQLVVLARVLLKDPAIFILDEATASVDPFTETQIQEGLEVLMRDRTAIVIAHRLSTVKSADRIIVMDRGADHRRGNSRRADGRRRSLCRPVQHLLPAPVVCIYRELAVEPDLTQGSRHFRLLCNLKSNATIEIVNRGTFRRIDRH